jgi:hypothetical protein
MTRDEEIEFGINRRTLKLAAEAYQRQQAVNRIVCERLNHSDECGACMAEHRKAVNAAWWRGHFVGVAMAAVAMWLGFMLYAWIH